jgi:hypothetical protein
MTRIQALSPTPHSPASDDFEERLAKHVEKICEIAGAREYLRGWIIGKQVGREEMLLEVLSLRFRPLTCAENTRVREACNEGQAVVEDMLRLQHWMTCSRSPYVRRRKRRPRLLQRQLRPHHIPRATLRRRVDQKHPRLVDLAAP